jgi:phage protein D
MADFDPFDVRTILNDVNLGNFDPFVGTAKQSNRLKAFCRIWVAGLEVTDKIEPHLVSVHIVDAPNPTCDIELDDRDARLPIPPLMSPVRVELGWTTESTFEVFNGVTQDVEHGFGRKQGGRRMWVHAMGTDFVGGQMKTPMQNSLGEGAPPGKEEGEKKPFGSWMDTVAKDAGATVNMHPALKAIQRDWWGQANESLIHHAQRMADEFGAVHQFTEGNKLAMTMPGETTDGGSTATVIAKWADNLIGWRVRPFAARSTWAQGNQQFYSQAAGQWMKMAQGFGMKMPWSQGQGVFSLPAPAPNQSVGGQQNDGAQEMSGFQSGHGRIVINGEPTAHWNGHVQLMGARPGVDGLYWIEVAEHLWSRQGYITWLDVQAESTSSGAGSISHSWTNAPNAPDAYVPDPSATAPALE